MGSRARAKRPHLTYLLLLLFSGVLSGVDGLGGGVLRRVGGRFGGVGRRGGGVLRGIGRLGGGVGRGRLGGVGCLCRGFLGRHRGLFGGLLGGVGLFLGLVAACGQRDGERKRAQSGNNGFLHRMSPWLVFDLSLIHISEPTRRTP